jgi:integrase/recombinase XerD
MIPEIIIWRNHVPGCPVEHQFVLDKCSCPIYKEWRVNGQRFKKSMKTRSLQKALAIKRELEREGIKKLTASLGIKDACDRYISDAQARDLKDPTLYKFRLLFRQLQEFAEDKGLVYMSDLNLDNLRQFRATWPNKNESARVKLGNFRAFIGFCHKAKWIEENYAQDLKAGKVVDSKIVPLEPWEIDQILKACDAHFQKARGILLKAMILVMLYTALRIRDVVTLSRDSVRGSQLYLRTAKTGVDVFCPLPPQVVEALAAIPAEGRWYFWNGASKPKSAVGDYQKSLAKVFKAAGVPRAYPHLFRHTCATNLLTQGVPLQTVSTLLGHTSIKMTERKYSHWIKGRQDKFVDDLLNSWAKLGQVEPISGPSKS